MQGKVNVKFTILSSGKVGNISVSGPKVFHNSARNAVKSAFPINAKNAPLPCQKVLISHFDIKLDKFKHN